MRAPTLHILSYNSAIDYLLKKICGSCTGMVKRGQIPLLCKNISRNVKFFISQPKLPSLHLNEMMRGPGSCRKSHCDHDEPAPSPWATAATIVFILFPLLCESIDVNATSQTLYLSELTLTSVSAQSVVDFLQRLSPGVVNELALDCGMARRVVEILRVYFGTMTLPKLYLVDCLRLRDTARLLSGLHRNGNVQSVKLFYISAPTMVPRSVRFFLICCNTFHN
jgi:hypothetical protein